jgi:hypothetical protein
MTSKGFGRRYFSKPPYKSFYFLVFTIYLLAVLSMAVLVGARFYDRLGHAGVGGGLWWMCLSVAAPIVLWVRAWQSHMKLYEMCAENDDSGDQTRVDTILTHAAYLENTGLGITLFVLMCALIGVSKILAK